MAELYPNLSSICPEPLTDAIAYAFRFSRYEHRFKSALRTHYGIWQVRQGLRLQLTDTTGRTHWGEVAPVPWFGSESLDQAVEFCQQLPSKITAAIANSIPCDHPACQFGFETALQSAHLSTLAFGQPVETLSFSRLLPAGRDVLVAWQPLAAQGIRTFKWKIGVFPLADELTLFNQLIQQLPSQTQLRLDANGGLSLAEAQHWLAACDAARHTFATATVEYLEQPLPRDQVALMQQLSTQFATPIALDESVATLPDLRHCYALGWRGVVVIKPAILGSPTQLREFCRHHPVDAVFSTAFETAIGRQAGLRLAAELGNRDRAVGYEGTWQHFDYFA